MRTKLSMAMLFVFAVIASHELSAANPDIGEFPVIDEPETQIALQVRD